MLDRDDQRDLQNAAAAASAASSGGSFAHSPEVGGRYEGGSSPAGGGSFSSGGGSYAHSPEVGGRYEGGSSPAGGGFGQSQGGGRGSFGNSPEMGGRYEGARGGGWGGGFGGTTGNPNIGGIKTDPFGGAGATYSKNRIAGGTYNPQYVTQSNMLSDPSRLQNPITVSNAGLDNIRIGAFRPASVLDRMTPKSITDRVNPKSIYDRVPQETEIAREPLPNPTISRNPYDTQVASVRYNIRPSAVQPTRPGVTRSWQSSAIQPVDAAYTTATPTPRGVEPIAAQNRINVPDAVEPRAQSSFAGNAIGSAGQFSDYPSGNRSPPQGQGGAQRDDPIARWMKQREMTRALLAAARDKSGGGGGGGGGGSGSGKDKVKKPKYSFQPWGTGKEPTFNWTLPPGLLGLFPQYEGYRA